MFPLCSHPKVVLESIFPRQHVLKVGVPLPPQVLANNDDFLHIKWCTIHPTCISIHLLFQARQRDVKKQGPVLTYVIVAISSPSIIGLSFAVSLSWSLSWFSISQVVTSKVDFISDWCEALTLKTPSVSVTKSTFPQRKRHHDSGVLHSVTWTCEHFFLHLSFFFWTS